MRTLLLGLVLCFSSPGAAFHAGAQEPTDPAAPQHSVQGEVTLESRAREVQAMISADPGWAEGLYDPAFLAAIAPAQLKQLAKTLFESYGPIVELTLEKRENEWSGRFAARTEQAFTIPINLTLDAQPPHAVVGLWFGPAVPRIEDWAGMLERLGKLRGKVSFGAWKLGDTLEPIAELNSDLPLALGSAFKLYVLGALTRELEQGALLPSSTVELCAQWRSLPSGRLQSWPLGLPLSVTSLAAGMISESDNTAADHLLFALGRDKVEAQLSVMGNAHASLSLPLLSTAEMFRLKLAREGALAEDYAKLELDARRKFLAEEITAAKLPLEQFEAAASSWTKPRQIGAIEWFGSARDMANAMDWLRRNTASEKTALVRPILAINPGLLIDHALFPYVGFKGGSEPGVLNLTYLLQHKSGTWYALSAGWNDPKRLLDDSQLTGLVTRAIELLEP